jgi:hypothetical protein
MMHHEVIFFSSKRFNGANEHVFKAKIGTFDGKNQSLTFGQFTLKMDVIID